MRGLAAPPSIRYPGRFLWKRRLSQAHLTPHRENPWREGELILSALLEKSKAEYPLRGTHEPKTLIQRRFEFCRLLP